jgi:hypothetical protein
VPLAIAAVAVAALAALIVWINSRPPPGPDPAEVAEVEEVLATYYGDPTRSCDVLGTRIVGASYGNVANCRRSFAEYESLELTQAEVELGDDEATARVTTSDGYADELELSKDAEGLWQIDDIVSSEEV